jgi:hypothetical protein
MTDERLSSFIETAKARGVDDASLVALLRQSGWQEQRIYRALTGYYSQTLGVEVPSRGNRAEDARDAFYHLLAFGTLGAWVVALIQLANGVVDRILPSPNGYVPDTGDLSWHIATIIIAFPIFLWVNVLIGREARSRPESLQSGVRKWLTYVALVIAAMVLIGDGIWLLASFLTGAVTTAFVVKCLVVLAITGGTFAYYLGSVRATDLPAWRTRLYGGIATAAVIIAMIAGFGPVGSPFAQQAIARDRAIERGLYDLASVANDDRMAAGAKSIPAALPNAKPGEYARIDANRYRLCATFEAASGVDEIDSWKHPAGHYCYTFDARRSPTFIPYDYRG